MVSNAFDSPMSEFPYPISLKTKKKTNFIHISTPISRYVVDSPEKYDLLKQGHLNADYVNIIVTSEAHPDILLQPQYFANAPFNSLKFEDGMNALRIFPTVKFVVIHFNDGENSLLGIPSNYTRFMINYGSEATPTVDNINSILQWSETEVLVFHDENSVVLFELLDRIDEMSRLTKIKTLGFALANNSYNRINVGNLVEKLPTLNAIELASIELDDVYKTEFVAKNPAPTSWIKWVDSNAIRYRLIPKRFGTDFASTEY